METVTKELSGIVEVYGPAISKIPESEFSSKPLSNKWSKKEVFGHLIDSGHNNLRRFICAQYETTPPKIAYDQDFWVVANGYQQAPSAHVIQSWVAVNQQICSVLNNMPAKNHSKNCDTGKNEIQLHTLEWLATDYVKHLKHHLNQIMPGSFDITYP